MDYYPLDPDANKEIIYRSIKEGMAVRRRSYAV